MGSTKFYPELRGVGGDLIRESGNDVNGICDLSHSTADLSGGRDGLRENAQYALGLCFRLVSTFYPLIGRQTQSVVEICRAMAQTECFTEIERRVLYLSSWLYDLGTIALNRSLLHRLLACPESCSPEEIALFRHHPIMGQSLASFVDRMPAVGATIRAHHERFDGTGYPDGLAGEGILWTARCLAVAVAFVQTGLPKEQAAAYLLEQSGRGLDPEAVRLFFKTNQLEDLPRNVREILLSELSPGMRLARGIHTSLGMLLLPEGQILNEIALQKIQNHSRHHLVTERILVYG
jgi:response regulator RpfG family c-di-GMP phosphodiesterase